MTDFVKGSHSSALPVISDTIGIRIGPVILFLFPTFNSAMGSALYVDDEGDQKAYFVDLENHPNMKP